MVSACAADSNHIGISLARFILDWLSGKIPIEEGFHKHSNRFVLQSVHSLLIWCFYCVDLLFLLQNKCYNWMFVFFSVSPVAELPSLSDRMTDQVKDLNLIKDLNVDHVGHIDHCL